MKSVIVPTQYLKKTLSYFPLFPDQDWQFNSSEKGKDSQKKLKEKKQLKNTFIRDFLSYLSLSTLFILLGLLIGILGYHWTAHLSWIDAMVEASMILSGMGPVYPLLTNNAKFFASLYALFSGLIFVLAMGVVLSPLVYSLLKQLRLNTTDQD